MAMEQYLYIHLSGGKQVASAIFGSRREKSSGVRWDIVSLPAQKMLAKFILFSS